jgi:hypothetical protein
VFEVCGLVAGDQFDDTAPHPAGGVQGLRSVAAEFCDPVSTGGSVHLPGVGFADDSCEIGCCCHCLFSGELVHLELEVLGHQLAEDDGA